VGEASCPKCGTARDAARTHCATCGLAHDKMAAFEKARDAVPDALAQAWERAVGSWDETARHDEVLRLAAQHDAYAWAAARYRERLKARADDEVAGEQLDRVRRAAEATLLANAAAARQKNTPEPYRSTMVLLAILIIAIIAGLVYVTARGSGDPPPPRRELVPPPVTK